MRSFESKAQAQTPTLLNTSNERLRDRTSHLRDSSVSSWYQSVVKGFETMHQPRRGAPIPQDQGAAVDMTQLTLMGSINA